MLHLQNEREIRILGMRRSGIHAELGWIMGMIASERLCVLNNVCTLNPFAGYDREAFPECQRWDAARRNLLIVYEDKSWEETLGSGAYDSTHDKLVGQTADRKDVLLLRDPFNLFASRQESQKKKPTPVDALQQGKRLWVYHARAYCIHSHACWRVPVTFNAWFASPEYRARIAERLGLPFSDINLNRLQPIANGSSFDGMQFQDRAQEMCVLERWKEHPDIARRLLEDGEVVELTETIFGGEFVRCIGDAVE